MKKIFSLILIFIFHQIVFSQPITFASLPNAPMGKALCFAYNNTINRIWVCTATKVFYSDNNGGSWINTAATGVTSPSAIALNVTGIPYIITPQNGMRHFNGTAWIADNNGLPVNPLPQFTSLAIDVAGNVYAGAGWHGLPPNYSGVWKWNGTVWSTMNNGLPTAPVSPTPEITSMAIDGSGNLFTGTAKVLLNGGGQGFGVYKWNGSSWNIFGTGLSNLNVASLAINNSGELFAGTFNSVSHISATAGGTWINSTAGLPPLPTTVRSITFDALNNIYAGLGYLPEQAGSLFGAVYISSNNGTSWTQRSAIANTTTAINAILTDNAGNIFAGASGIYKSTNQGNTWAIDTVGLIKVRARGGYVAINSVGHIFSAGEGDVFKSVDGGATWQLIINGIDRHDLSCIAVDKNDNIYLGGQIWVGGSVRIDSGRVWKSTDGGNTWLKATVHDNQIMEFKITPSNNVYVALTFGGGGNASYSSNGTTWVPLNIANPNGGGAFSIDVNKRNHIFIGTEIGQVKRSIDGGTNFTSSTNLLPGNIGLVRISPHDGVFVSGGTAFNTPSLSYSDSINNGVTFTLAANFPIGKAITDIVFDNRDSMYVGTKNGLYTTTLPFNPSTSIFSLNASNGAASITSFAKDNCGYLYNSNYFAAIAKSTIPVDLNTACNILPVTFLDFSGNYIKSSNEVKLQWSVTNEINIHHYNIEKSGDGNSFKLLNTVNVKSYSGLSNNYLLDDFAAFDGKNFYRISEITNDGNITYHNTIVVTKPIASASSLLLFPNPAGSFVTLSLQNLLNRKEVTIISVCGATLNSFFIPPQQTRCNINLKDIPAGMYFIKLTEIETGRSFLKKIIKE